MFTSELIIRLIGAVVFCVAGMFLGVTLGSMASLSPWADFLSVELYAVVFGLLGALFGLILTPHFTTRPYRLIRRYLIKASAQKLFAAIVGLVVGLVIAALLSFPLSLLPSPFNNILPFFGVLIFGYMGATIFSTRQNDLFTILAGFRQNSQAVPENTSNGSGWGASRTILLDTSVIIDGRIADIARTGFLPGTIVIPRFVLTELQYIADSADNLRRQRGRRGMEVLSQLQKDPSITVRMSDIDVEGVRDVDDKLVILARQMRCPILTNDFNLNRIAELQGVTVLNVNELTNAVKSVLLPGELLSVRIIQEGKELEQGVGYLDDGTMVVVENGRHFLNQEINVSVTKVLQTAAGRMIFARPDSDN
jgi:uncharacterized protein YacL